MGNTTNLFTFGELTNRLLSYAEINKDGVATEKNSQSKNPKLQNVSNN